MEHCPQCSGKLTIIAAILEQPAALARLVSDLQLHAADSGDHPSNWTDAEKQAELDNNAQGILG